MVLLIVAIAISHLLLLSWGSQGFQAPSREPGSPGMARLPWSLAETLRASKLKLPALKQGAQQSWETRSLGSPSSRAGLIQGAQTAPRKPQLQQEPRMELGAGLVSDAEWGAYPVPRAPAKILGLGWPLPWSQKPNQPRSTRSSGCLPQSGLNLVTANGDPRAERLSTGPLPTLGHQHVSNGKLPSQQQKFSLICNRSDQIFCTVNQHFLLKLSFVR